MRYSRERLRRMSQTGLMWTWCAECQKKEKDARGVSATRMIKDILQKQKVSRYITEGKEKGLAVRAALAYARKVVREEINEHYIQPYPGEIIMGTEMKRWEEARKRTCKRLMEHTYYRYRAEEVSNGTS